MRIRPCHRVLLSCEIKKLFIHVIKNTRLFTYVRLTKEKNGTMCTANMVGRYQFEIEVVFETQFPSYVSLQHKMSRNQL
jgi:hypothetical protein